MLKKLNLNLSNVASDNESLLDNGVYDAKITQAVQRISKSGNEMLEVIFEVTGDTGVTGSIREFIVLNSSHALRRLKDLLIAANFSNPDCLSSADELVGLKMQVVLVQKMGDYGLKSKIVQFLQRNKANKSSDITGQVQTTFDDLLKPDKSSQDTCLGEDEK